MDDFFAVMVRASKLHLFCHDSPLRACCRTQIRLWGFAFDTGGLLYWCSNDPAAESGERYLGNVGSNIVRRTSWLFWKQVVAARNCCAEW